MDKELEIEQLLHRISGLEDDLAKAKGANAGGAKIVGELSQPEGNQVLEDQIQKQKDTLIDKDKEILSLRKKLDALAQQNGVQDIIRSTKNLRLIFKDVIANSHRRSFHSKEISEVKNGMDVYVKAGDVLWENKLLRQAANIPQDKLLDVTKLKLQEKISPSVR